MSLALQISATFLTGRYHGDEWPPSPARLVQALVAAAKTGANRSMWPSVKEGFLWLEKQLPPRIRSRDECPLKNFKIAVPNNDFDVIAKDWAAGRVADPSRLRTLKTIKPRGLTNPSLQPHLQYIWSFDGSELASKAVQCLAPAVRSLYSLGWGIDMAFAESQVTEETDASEWIEWVPSEHGVQRAVPVPGFLDDLEATYERFVARSSGKGVDADTRPSVYRFQRYERSGLTRPPYASFGLRTLDDEEVFSHPWHNLIEIAAWMRHAAGEHLKGEELGEELGAYVFGHPEKIADANNRLSYVPLPSIHSIGSDGRVRRVMVTEPIGTHGRITDILKSKWRAATLQKDGKAQCLLTSQEDTVTRFYTDVGERWNSVTPVVLHGHNATRGAISLAKN